MGAKPKPFIMTKTAIEQEAAKTILQRNFNIMLGGKVFSVRPPSMATLIAMSEFLAEIPTIDIKDKNALSKAISDASHYEPVVDAIVAVVVGERKPDTMNFLQRRRYDRRKLRLRTLVMQKASIAEIEHAIVTIINSMELEHFFGVITFLAGLNLTKATKVNSTTASGQPSEAL